MEPLGRVVQAALGGNIYKIASISLGLGIVVALIFTLGGQEPVVAAGYGWLGASLCYPILWAINRAASPTFAILDRWSNDASDRELAEIRREQQDVMRRLDEARASAATRPVPVSRTVDTALTVNRAKKKVNTDVKPVKRTRKPKTKPSKISLIMLDDDK